MRASLLASAIASTLWCNLFLAASIQARFYDRLAALMHLARLRGMITDSSKTFHFHEDLARMPPEEQHKRVAELLEFAASLKVPETIDVEPNPDEEE
jgi:hypothetical protein